MPTMTILAFRHAASRIAAIAILVAVSACSAPEFATAPKAPPAQGAEPYWQTLNLAQATLRVRPIDGVVARPYGIVIDPDTGDEAFHRAVDYAANAGDVVVAPGAGLVTRVEPNGPERGMLIEIAHGGDLFSRYAHLDSVGVSTGDSVIAGQEIGRVGDGGPIIGPGESYLHMEVLGARIRGGQDYFFDPERVLPQGRQ